MTAPAELPSSLLERARRTIVASPWIPALGIFLLALLVVQPWGNYALNDDWTYSHVAKRFAETGVLKIDTPVVANTVGQSMLAAPVIVIFGFSFVALRLYTMALALLCLWLVDRVLRVVAPEPAVRIAALLLLGLNPIFFYSSLTFMTEIYGWLPGLSAAALWFWDRQRRGPDERVVAWWVAAVCGLLGAFPFWIRQPCVVIYAAIIGGTLGRMILNRDWRGLRRALPVVGVGAAVFLATVALFFYWAISSGNFPFEFQKRLPNLLRFDSTTWIMQSGAAVFYQTAYFLPFLLLLWWPRVSAWKRTAIASLVVFGLAFWARDLFERIGGNDYGHGMMWAHKSFPFLMNIIYAGGIGPITVSDVFWSGQPGPHWPVGFTKSIEYFLLAATLLWGPLIVAAGTGLRRILASVGAEVLLFAMLLPIVGLSSIIQGHQNELLDRYQMPLILGFAVLLPATVAIHFRNGSSSVFNWRRGLTFGLTFLPIAVFSVGGLHDMFRWNDARWELVAEGYRQGATLSTLEAGFESSCWYREEGMTADHKGCGETCSCSYFAACCLDDRWRVGMSVLPGYTPLKEIKPSWWLVDGPSLHLSSRPSQP